MGIGKSKAETPQILLCGLDGAGKTSLLYTESYESAEFTCEPTKGINVEEVGSGTRTAIVFDVGGSETGRALWPTLYKEFHFNAVIFVIDFEDDSKFYEAKQELETLANEEDLRDSVMAIVYNKKTQAEVEEVIVDDEDEYVREQIRLLEDVEGKLDPKERKKKAKEFREKKMLKDIDELAKEEEFLEAIKKHMDLRLNLEEMHSYKVKRSFIFNVLDRRKNREGRRKEMYDWILQKVNKIEVS